MSETSTTVSHARPATGLAPIFSDVWALTKPRVSVLVVVTAAAGIALAPGTAPLPRALLALLGVWMIVAAANVLNCWVERDFDRKMSRTANRPLAAGRLHPNVGLMFGAALAVVSTIVLTFALNPLTGLLGVGSLMLYVGAYTPLKTRTPIALLVGAIPGAMPPVMGYSAIAGDLAAPAFVLFALQFLWQLPHFIAIATARKTEYSRAGFRVLPAVHGIARARAEAIFWATLLLPVPLMLVPMGFAGPLFFALAGVAGVAYLGMALRSASHPNWSKRLFWVSLAYLPVVLAALAIDRV